MVPLLIATELRYHKGKLLAPKEQLAISEHNRLHSLIFGLEPPQSHMLLVAIAQSINVQGSYLEVFAYLLGSAGVIIATVHLATGEGIDPQPVLG